MFIEHIRVSSLLNIKLNSNFYGVIVPLDPIMYRCKQHLAECIGLLSEESIPHQPSRCRHFHGFLHHWYWMKSLTKHQEFWSPRHKLFFGLLINQRLHIPPGLFLELSQSHQSTCSVSVCGHLVSISDFLASLFHYKM